MANKLPTSVYSIIVVEFLERYSYYAMRAILTMYFSESLHLSDSTSVSFFLYTSALAYFTPCVGGYLSDSRWGKFATISRFGSIYVVGFLVLSFSALQSKMSGTMIGLVLIGIGTGGIKPCVSSFGADQLPDPNDEKKLRKYFSTPRFPLQRNLETREGQSQLLRRPGPCSSLPASSGSFSIFFPETEFGGAPLNFQQ